MMLITILTLSGQLVCIHHCAAEILEEFADCAFPSGYTTCQADQKHTCHRKQLNLHLIPETKMNIYIIVLGRGPKNEVERSANLVTKIQACIKISGHIDEILRQMI